MQERKAYTQLQPEDRITLASMKQRGQSVRAMARTLGRAPSTISRELRRNTLESVGYASRPAQIESVLRRRAARPAPKLALDGVVWRVVLTLLDWKDILHPPSDV